MNDIVLNGKFLSAPPTGVHRVAAELIEHLDQILESRPDLARERRWSVLYPRDGRNYMSLRKVAPQRKGQLTWQFWEQFELPYMARDALLVNLCNLAPLASARSITMIHDAQVFITPQSYSRAFRSWYQFALPRIGMSSALILTVSQYSRDRLAEYGIAPREKIEVVTNGADHLLRVAACSGIVRRLGLTPGRYAVALANTQKHKNIQVLLRAFAEPDMRDLTLVLVGCLERSQLAELAPVLPDNVVLAGRVSDGEMRALLENAATLAFPSLTEGFGLPPLEAMSLGCPAVVSPRGALPEACGSAATYVEPEDVTGWARAIRRFADDGLARQSAAENGRRRAARFTWAASAASVLQAILRVAQA